MTTKERDTYETFKWSFGKASDSSRRLLVFLYSVSLEDSAEYKRMVRALIGSYGKIDEMIDAIKEDRLFVESSMKDNLINYLTDGKA